MKPINWILRKIGYTPIKKAATRELSAGKTNRLTADWSTLELSVDSVLRIGLTAVRARAKDLKANNVYFKKYISMLISNVLGGEGLALKNKASDPIGFKNGKITPGKLDTLANKLVEDAWWEWGKKENCTISKDMTWLEVQTRALDNVGTFGETLWRMVIGEEADNAFGFALQVIPTSRIDSSLNRNLENGGRIRLGVEYDSIGRKVAIWLHESDPADSMAIGGYGSKRHDAKNFIHPFLVTDDGQSRGFPPAAVAMLRAKMLDGYEEAHLVGTRAAASKMGVLKKMGQQEYGGETTGSGGHYMDAEPGSIETLPDGLEFQTVDWGYPNGGYGEFVKDCLRGIAAGFNVSYNTLANDLEGVNFSSGRLGLMDEREGWKLLQSWLGTNFNTPIFGKWLESSLMAEAIALELPSGERKPLPLTKFQKFNQPNWHGRRWQWVDPTKEVSAKVMELNAGLTSITRVLAEQNIDRDELFNEIKDDRDALALLGIQLSEMPVTINVGNEADGNTPKPDA